MSSIEKKVFNLLSAHKNSWLSVFKATQNISLNKSSRLLTGALRLGKKGFNENQAIFSKMLHMIHCGKSPRRTYEDFFISIRDAACISRILADIFDRPAFFQLRAKRMVFDIQRLEFRIQRLFDRQLSKRV